MTIDDPALYYPTDNNVYSLNPATRKREIVAALPFGPRCIGAKYGWVCAGGVENGQFASIRVRQQEKNSDQRRGDGEVEEREGATESTSRSQRRISPDIKISQLGGLIVNSVTLHRPPSSKSDDDVLAVLT
ncbi:hypothetical protein C7212DRAFT_348794 [Tuber magnatum]|uniref:Uncharacterized protein n=1 Tax=Tuber magnatum TaxID=42249 RepID=A0A317SB75_9PEZI|nr:hypothetical protein C7212DRAFT_348794 [Tuber magnatum]